VIGWAALLLVSAALAAEPPAATAVAERGSQKVVSRVLLTARGGELKGTWYDTKAACTAERRLQVSYLTDLVVGAKTTRKRSSKSGSAPNCAEGGPNFGFDVTARALGMACPSGRWTPGRYAITVRTFDAVSGLRAVASLYWQETSRC
jgi:hypothetical protein